MLKNILKLLSIFIVITANAEDCDFRTRSLSDAKNSSCPIIKAQAMVDEDGINVSKDLFFINRNGAYVPMVKADLFDLDKEDKRLFPSLLSLIPDNAFYKSKNFLPQNKQMSSKAYFTQFAAKIPDDKFISTEILSDFSYSKISGSKKSCEDCNRTNTPITFPKDALVRNNQISLDPSVTCFCSDPEKVKRYIADYQQILKDLPPQHDSN